MATLHPRYLDTGRLRILRGGRREGPRHRPHIRPLHVGLALRGRPLGEPGRLGLLHQVIQSGALSLVEIAIGTLSRLLGAFLTFLTFTFPLLGNVMASSDLITIAIAIIPKIQ